MVFSISYELVLWISNSYNQWAWRQYIPTKYITFKKKKFTYTFITCVYYIPICVAEHVLQQDKNLLNELVKIIAIANRFYGNFVKTLSFICLTEFPSYFYKNDFSKPLIMYPYRNLFRITIIAFSFCIQI